MVKTLAIKELIQPHTSEYLNTVLMDVLTDYQINIKQILSITTDNGANMVKAVNDLNDSSCTEDEADNFEDNTLMPIESFPCLKSVTNIRCGAHTLHLCVMDVLKTDNIKEKIGRFRMIVKKLKTQTYLNLLKTTSFKMPLLDCVTRLNSTYIMLERLVELKEFINMIKYDNALFNVDFWDFVSEFLKTFKIIYAASKKLQAENIIYSDLYIQIIHTILQLENLPSTELNSVLLTAINKKKIVLFDNHLFVTAVFFDPRVKVSLSADQVVKAKECIMQLHSRLSSLKGRPFKNMFHIFASIIIIC